MNGSLLRGIVVNLCFIFSSSLIYAEGNELFNFIHKVADGTQQVAKGIIHETGRVLQPDRKPTATKQAVVTKKNSVAKKKHKSNVNHMTKKTQKSKTVLAQQAPDQNQTSAAPGDTNAMPTPAAPATGGDASSTPSSPATGGDVSSTPSAPATGGDTGSLPTTQEQNSAPSANTGTSTGGNSNIPDVAEPGQSGTINAPNDNQLPEPPQSNDTTTGITGGDAY